MISGPMAILKGGHKQLPMQVALCELAYVLICANELIMVWRTKLNSLQ